MKKRDREKGKREKRERERERSEEREKDCLKKTEYKMCKTNRRPNIQDKIPPFNLIFLNILFQIREYSEILQAISP